MSNLRAFDVFCGAGGLALGVSKAGFDYTAVLDYDEVACETLRHNKTNGAQYARSWEILEEDAQKFCFKTFEDRVDLLTGGPPCQPFSRGGKGDGQRDERDQFPSFIRALREVRPKAVLFENVSGLLSKAQLEYFQYIIDQMRFPTVLKRHREKWTEHRARLQKLYTSGAEVDVKYNVIFQKLRAQDYGVPQRRDRVFAVGIRADLHLEYSFPLPTHDRLSLLREQHEAGAYWARHGISPKAKLTHAETTRLQKLWVKVAQGRPWRTVRDAISDLPKLRSGAASLTDPNHFFNPGARSYSGHDGCDPDWPSKTIKAGHHGVPGGENTLKLGKKRVRYFTVRECARLQTFPDDWTFLGAWTRGMSQVGNAVPVDLATAVAEPLVAVLTNATLIGKQACETHKPTVIG